MIQVKPKDSVAEVVMRLKSGSSKKIREEFSELEEFVWGGGFWADGYFAETIDNVDEATMKNYLKNQWARFYQSFDTPGVSPGSRSFDHLWYYRRIY